MEDSGGEEVNLVGGSLEEYPSRRGTAWLLLDVGVVLMGSADEGE